MKIKDIVPIQSEILVYHTSDGRIRLDARLQNESIWLSQKQLAELFQTSVANINMHIRNVFAEGELDPDSVVKDFLITASDAKTYRTKHYNLDLIISVGYRMKSTSDCIPRLSSSCRFAIDRKTLLFILVLFQYDPFFYTDSDG